VFCNDTPPPAIYPLSLHDALPIYQTLRAIYWAAQKAGKITEAWNHLNEIEGLYGLNPTPSHARWLEKARKGPIMNLALFDEIVRSEEHTSELQSRENLVCRLLLEK